ncbi:hypothetical protein PITCH_A1640029 [uncultured Desulfobacterium sp.]|uniref:Uncharacterized protein n=1 Tax=uncultured Desulfobacterium sp. TaxID=201089 RepID=A0A445MUE0_9BACT|nr:hypothetical protein PITCH_A1640029 [uncultured Desulfobacterium sp.]
MNDPVYDLILKSFTGDITTWSSNDGLEKDTPPLLRLLMICSPENPRDEQIPIPVIATFRDMIKDGIG